MIHHKLRNQETYKLQREKDGNGKIGIAASYSY